MANADASVLVSISDMIDLAIGTPEVGVVDFNMLQTVLHCLAQQLRCLSKNVELRGSFAALPMFRDNAQTVAVYEFVVEVDDKSIVKKGEVAPQVQKDTPETILVVERIRKTESPNRSRTQTRDGSPENLPASIAAGRHTVAPQRTGSREKVSLVTVSKFNLLENAVRDLKKQVNGTLPKNKDILDDVRSQTNVRSITDMWASMNMQSRVEAAEKGVSTLSSIVEDLIKQVPGVPQDLIARIPKIEAPPPSSGQDQPKSYAPTGISGGQLAPLQRDLKVLKSHVKAIQSQLEPLAENFYNAVGPLNVKLTTPTPPKPELPPLESDNVSLSSYSTARGGQQPDINVPNLTAVLKPIKDRLCECEKKLQKTSDRVGKGEDMVNDQLNSFQDQLEEVAKQQAINNSGDGKLSPDLIKDLQGLMQLFQTVQEMQNQLRDVHETALQLAAEKDDRQHHLNSLLEQIELLKIVKLDREDMLEALAEKADMRLLARKVSHDQFELACDDLSKGLEHALGKLNMQESLWQQALDDIQREIETKLDKMELSPVKDFFNGKLRQLQENLKQMASLRREAEAAGTKRRLLRDVNCISCDANAVMQMEQGPSLPAGKPMPGTLSMKPFLTYELDAIRKQRASAVPQRNMLDWETMDKQMAQPKAVKARTETDKHICNRYCGGSHTVTSPAQRVARFGHFIKQWGPDVLPLSSTFAAGDDGKMYKVAPIEGPSAGSRTPSFNATRSSCIKCTVEGIWDRKGRHMSYPMFQCPLRTDASFRSKLDEDHHLQESPLLELPIDMVEDFIVADSLHLLDLAPQEPAKTSRKSEMKPPKTIVITTECRCLDGGGGH